MRSGTGDRVRQNSIGSELLQDVLALQSVFEREKEIVNMSSELAGKVIVLNGGGKNQGGVRSSLRARRRQRGHSPPEFRSCRESRSIPSFASSALHDWMGIVPISGGRSSGIKARGEGARPVARGIWIRGSVSA